MTRACRRTVRTSQLMRTTREIVRTFARCIHYITHSALNLCSTFSGCAVSMSFFFQAEDGIRDLTVTGVQTCALPISLLKTRDPLGPHSLALAEAFLAVLSAAGLPERQTGLAFALVYDYTLGFALSRDRKSVV